MLILFVLFTATSFGSCDTDYFWHVSDFHYDPYYWTTQESCHYNLTGEEQGKYGNYICDPPWELLQSAVVALKTEGPSPAGIIWTGQFPGVPVYVTLGNHDYYPSSQMPGEENEVYDAAAEMWKKWLDTEDAQTTFKKGGYYTRVMDSSPGTKLRVISVNTNLYYASNRATEGEKDPAGQYQWMETTLTNARDSGEKVHVIMHIPSGSLELPGRTKWLRPEHNKLFNNLVLKYADIIVAVYSCHQHFDTFRIFYDHKGAAVAFNLITPSVTPWTGRVPEGIVAKTHNPGVRKVIYDKERLALVDIEQYWLDLPAANERETAEWKQLYSYSSSYGMNEVTAASLHGVLAEFKQPQSSQFQHYYTHNSVNERSESACDCWCKAEHLCAIEFVDYDEYTACMDEGYCTGGARRVNVTFVILMTCAIFLY